MGGIAPYERRNPTRSRRSWSPNAVIRRQGVAEGGRHSSDDLQGASAPHCKSREIARFELDCLVEQAEFELWCGLRPALPGTVAALSISARPLSNRGGR